MEQVIDFLITKGLELGEKCFSAILVLVIGLYLSQFVTKFVVKAMNRAKIELTLISFVRSVTSSGLKVVVIISAIGALGFPTASLFAIFGTAGAALALGFKDNLSNFVSGIIILFTKPFMAGDYIEVNQFAGTVKEIQVMFTVLNTIDNKRIVVPNSQMTQNIIVNSTHEEHRRLELTFDVAYDADIEKVKAVIHDVILSHPKALKNPEPLIRVSGYKESSVQVLLRAWCENDDFVDFRFDMLEQVKAAFDKEGIKIPFNQLDVTLKAN